MTRQQPNWGRIATFSLISTIVVAVILFFALEDDWIAGVVLGLGVVEAAFLLLVMPRLTGRETQTPIRDGDWGVPPPSEPSPPDRD